MNPGSPSEESLAHLVDLIERRPVDLSDERLARDREALEDAVFEQMTKPQPRRSWWRSLWSAFRRRLG